MAMTTRRWLRLTDHTAAVRVHLSTHGPPRVTSPEYRATQCEVTYERKATTVRLRPQPFDHRLPFSHPDVSRWNSALAAGAKSQIADSQITVTASLIFTLGRRHYSDGEGLSFQHQTRWCHLWIRAVCCRGAHHLTDGTPCLEEVPALLADMVGELTERATAVSAPLPAHPIRALVFTPTVAAVLVHELIGHVAEELPTDNYPLRLGSDRFVVTAHHPRVEGFDDEGVPAGVVPVVVGGMLSAPVLDSLRARDEGGAPTGLAQAPWHQGPPRARCTHLRVAPSESTDSLLAGIGHAVLCSGTSGAELVGRHAVLGVSSAALLRDGQPTQRLRPFHIGIDLADLADHLVAVGDDVRPGRAGQCVKGGHALMTRVLTPTLVLQGVQPRAD